MTKFRISNLLVVLFASLFLISCNKGKDVSPTTGWNYNDPENGGFYVTDSPDQIVGPGLVAIEGGTFTMGSTAENIYYEWNNSPRQVTVTSFFMDQTEVSNLDYLEYLYWLNRVYGPEYPDVVKKALPDTLVWRSSLSYNEPMVEVYLRHPAYREYPVVGVSWLQANDYALWRTDRVNEMLLVEANVITFDVNQTKDSHFTTDAYLAGQYTGTIDEGIEDLNPNGTGIRNVKMEDGILLPKYRLPTEAEWEYAALGLVGNTQDERISERRTYPWNTDALRTNDKKYYGSFVANFKRGKGDYMGVAGSLNDAAAFPAPVVSYWPNDYGLYNMAGNVSEWVLDVYRPLSFEDFNDHNPYRGNLFTEKYIDTLGQLQERVLSNEELAERKNYRDSYALNYNDGDFKSTIQNDWTNQEGESDEYTNEMYEYGVTTLISDKARVYKGGSWADGAYYLSPSVRRFMNEDESSSTIGFRCAMNKIGPAMTK
ncbi:MAG: SUMF1/EgtB/PvdO family nonheme iron enzyme [Bacteroidales bacterium]|nr:SUMF1/EgtB/PvdO family nonheme iron enzyme [Bacteroidales bacterium]MBR7176172.1 SUMF1/EgtB/PvdO family nonheme iron enzyme [Bacteroidales bacterium]